MFIRSKRAYSLFALGLLVSLPGTFCVNNLKADEPSRLSRLFRFGANPPKAASLPKTSEPRFGTEGPAGLESTTPIGSVTGPGSIDGTAPTPVETGTNVQPRITPQPRQSRPLTEADPMVTRIALGRSTEGRQFGMFLQVFEDGTVIDSEGVHKLGKEAIRPIKEAIEHGEIFRSKGHCGEPSTDFIEHVQLLVYDRRFGQLRANSISFAGNGQGCDHPVKHLQNLLDGLQTRLGQAKSMPMAGSNVEPSTISLSPVAPAPTSVPAPTSTSIPLTNEPDLAITPISESPKSRNP